MPLMTDVWRREWGEDLLPKCRKGWVADQQGNSRHGGGQCPLLSGPHSMCRLGVWPMRVAVTQPFPTFCSGLRLDCLLVYLRRGLQQHPQFPAAVLRVQP